MVVDRRRAGRGITLVKAAIGDGTGFLYVVWFNQPWLADRLRRGDRIDVYGRVERSYGELQMRSPAWEPSESATDVGRLVPIYPATEGVTERFLRSLIDDHLDAHVPDLRDVLPDAVRSAYHVMSRREAVRTLHRPTDQSAFERARQSLAFEELFLLQVGLLDRARSNAGVARPVDHRLADSLLSALPFRLTRDQITARREILEDLRRPVRMMRLLQGDVGSGKTLVAVLAALATIESGAQVAFMVPTEILAEQHARSLDRLLADLPVRTALLTGATKDRQQMIDAIEAGDVDLVIGTHALIGERVAFSQLGLVLIDEQHRFGVVQRSAIEEKGDRVDLLVMSATPIPRTIALTLYGEFDVSVLREMPTGTRRLRTRWVRRSERENVYREIGEFLAAGRKGYVVLPLVEESDKLDLASAVDVADEMGRRFPGTPPGLVHGRLPTEERQRVMDEFLQGETRLLVATTVIEVGIDVQDADFMVIEHAERFGLSQLHQLRGRIGRAGQPAECIALADAVTPDAGRRLAAFEKHDDGFEIAEEDLAIRGPGDLLGTHQHGFLTQLRAVDLVSDLDIMSRARRAAIESREEGLSDDVLDEVERRFGDLLRWLHV